MGDGSPVEGLWTERTGCTIRLPSQTLRCLGRIHPRNTDVGHSPEIQHHVQLSLRQNFLAFREMADQLPALHRLLRQVSCFRIANAWRESCRQRRRSLYPIRTLGLIRLDAAGTTLIANNVTVSAINPDYNPTVGATRSPNISLVSTVSGNQQTTVGPTTTLAALDGLRGISSLLRLTLKGEQKDLARMLDAVQFYQEGPTVKMQAEFSLNSLMDALKSLDLLGSGRA